MISITKTVYLENTNGKIEVFARRTFEGKGTVSEFREVIADRGFVIDPDSNEAVLFARKQIEDQTIRLLVCTAHAYGQELAAELCNCTDSGEGFEKGA